MFAMCTPNIKYEPYDHSEEVPLCQKKAIPISGRSLLVLNSKGSLRNPLDIYNIEVT